jgi:two-component system, OmpR family, KDP operon response regulator KdpE
VIGNKLTLVLLVSAPGSIGEQWNAALVGSSADVQTFHTVKDAIKTMHSIRYDLILLDDELFAGETVEFVREAKRRFPTTPILVLAADMGRKAALVEAGSIDVLPRDIDESQLRIRTQLILNQQSQSQALMQLSHKLNVMASLPRVLYSAPDPHTLILRAVKLICSSLNLYGAVVMLQEDDVYRIYAGGAASINQNKLYEGVVRPDDFDPFLWSMTNKTTQVYSNISANRNYTPIPILTDPHAVAVIPLTYHVSAMGAMGIYAPEGVPITAEDLIIYEQFSTQVSLALRNLHEHRTQHANIETQQLMLRAWQIFEALETPEQLVQAFSDIIEGVPFIGFPMIWLRVNDEYLLADTQNNTLVEQLREAWTSDMAADVFDTLTQHREVTILNQDSIEATKVAVLLKLLKTTHLIVSPVGSPGSEHPSGCIIAGVSDYRRFGIESMNLLQNLAHTVGQVLERMKLLDALREQNTRLEATLHSISEGIFFVDENDTVTFCNLQVNELTGMQTTHMLNKDSDSLLRWLASGKAAMMSDAPTDYPIVELSMPKLERRLDVEFMPLGKFGSWIGVIRNSAVSKRVSAFQIQLIQVLGDRMRMPYTDIASIINALVRQHGHLSYRERDNLLNKAELSIESVVRLWNSFSELHTLETGGFVLKREATQISELIEHVLASREFDRYRHSIRYDSASGAAMPPVKLDEFRFERAFSDVLRRAVTFGEVHVLTELHDDTIRIVVQDSSAPLSDPQLEQLFEPFSSATMDFGLYYAREIIRRHGGRMRAERSTSGGTQVIIELVIPGVARAVEKSVARVVDTPRTEARDGVRDGVPTRDIVTVRDTTRDSVRGERPSAARVPDRELRAIMLITGQSTLMDTLHELMSRQDVELLEYESGLEAISDVTATKLDLIVADITIGDIEWVECCKRLRKRTEVPILLIADKASDQDKVNGLNAGADDFLVKPISNEELLARVQVIFKRQQIPDRTSEPLVIHDLFVDFARREVFLANKPVELTRIEYDLLHTLITHRGQVLTHKQLLEKVWGPEYVDETHYLWVNVSRLRKKLESKNDGTRYIHTQLGIGYYFEPV